MSQGALAVTNYAAKFIPSKYSNFAATTAGSQIKTGAGLFLGWEINIAGTGGANIFTLYDGTSTGGAVIGIFNTAATTAPLRPTPVAFKTGLFIVLTGTSTSGNITVVYD